MAGTKISQLPTATTPLTGAELVPVVQSGTTYQTTAQGVANLTALPLAASGGSNLVGFLQAGTGAVARTLQAKARDFVSVKDFGAVGDGVTDDTAAIQAALSTGKDVYVPTGTFSCATALQMSANQTLYGSGPNSILKQPNGLHGLITGATNAQVKDLQLFGAYSTAVQKPFNAASAIANGTAFNVSGTTRINLFVGITGTATVQLQQSADGVSGWTQVGSNYTASADAYVVSVTQNYVRAAITAYTSGTVTVYIGLVQPTTDTVSNALVNAGNGMVIQDVTFTNATAYFVNASGAYGVVVRNCIGSYSGLEGVLQSSGASLTVDGCNFSNTLKAAIDSNVSSTVITNNRITIAGFAGSVDANVGIWAVSQSSGGAISGMRIDGNTIETTASCGIYIQASSGYSMTDVSVCNNKVRNSGQSGTTPAIQLIAQTVNQIQNYQVSNNIVDTCTGAGIYVGNCQYGVISGNEIYNVLTANPANQGAIFLGLNFAALESQVIGNTILGIPTSATGIRVEGSSYSVSLNYVNNLTGGAGIAVYNAWPSATAGFVISHCVSTMTSFASAGGSVANISSIGGNLVFGADATFTANLFVPGAAIPVFKTSASITSGAGVSTGTLTNAPAAGNPTKWIPIVDNGTTRYFPAW